MSNIADKLNALVGAKNDIKTALESKGVSPTGGLSTYADAIRSIESGSGGGTISKWVDGWRLGWSSFVEAPMLDTSDITDMDFMFYACMELKSVPLYNTSKVTDMSNMFEGCRSLTTVPQFDTSKVMTMKEMFYDCKNLTSVPKLDASNVYNMLSTFDGCENLTDIGGFYNLGKSWYLGNLYYTFAFCNNITRDSVLNIFNNLYDRTNGDYETIKIHFPQSVINRLSNEDIAIATNKGWIVGAV